MFVDTLLLKEVNDLPFSSKLPKYLVLFGCAGTPR